MNVEECLRQIEAKAALIRYLASSATINPESPDPAVLAGVGGVCGEIENLARMAKKVMGVEALGIEVNVRL